MTDTLKYIDLALTLYLLCLIDRGDKNLTRIWHRAVSSMPSGQRFPIL